MPREQEIEEIQVKILEETEKAFKLQSDEDTAWFPKSQISFRRRNTISGEALAEIPLWILREKGWI